MPKLFWVDIGLWRSMTGIRDTVTGECFETFSEIFKYFKTMGIDARLGYYRTRSGTEIDLIIEFGGRIWGIEVKSRERVVPADARPLKRLAEALGERWGGGLIVYRGDTLQRLEKKL